MRWGGLGWGGLGGGGWLGSDICCGMVQWGGGCGMRWAGHVQWGAVAQDWDDDSDMVATQNGVDANMVAGGTTLA